MDLLKYLEPMKNLPKRFSNLAFWRDVRKFKDEVVNAFEYVDAWGTHLESIIGIPTASPDCVVFNCAFTSSNAEWVEISDGVYGLFGKSKVLQFSFNNYSNAIYVGYRFSAVNNDTNSVHSFTPPDFYDTGFPLVAMPNNQILIKVKSWDSSGTKFPFLTVSSPTPPTWLGYLRVECFYYRR